MHSSDVSESHFAHVGRPSIWVLFSARGAGVVALGGVLDVLEHTNVVFCAGVYICS